MQFDGVGIGIAHFRDRLTLGHVLTFLNQDRAVVCVGRQQVVAVFDNYEITITADAAARIHHLPGTGRHHHLAQLAGNVDALVLAFVEGGDDLAVGRPHPAQLLVVVGDDRAAGRQGARGRRLFFLDNNGFRILFALGFRQVGLAVRLLVAARADLFRDRRRPLDAGQGDRRGHDGRAAGGIRAIVFGRRDVQQLADLDVVRIGQVIPAHQVAVVLAVVERDTDQGVAAAYGIGAARVRLEVFRRRWRHGGTRAGLRSDGSGTVDDGGLPGRGATSGQHAETEGQQG